VVETTDAQRVEAGGRGHAEAYRPLVTRYPGHVCRLAYRVLDSRAEASDDPVRDLAPPAARRRMAELIRQCRDHDADAADHIERTLTRHH